MQGGSSPAPAVLERAVPRTLTDDGRLFEGGAVSMPTATAARACGVAAVCTQHQLSLTGLPPAAVQSAAAAASPGNESNTALQLAKQRALAFADALSGEAEQPPRPEESVTAGAAPSQTAAVAPEPGAIIPAVQVGVPMLAAAAKHGGPMHGDVPSEQQQQQADLVRGVSVSADGAGQAALALLLCDYADDDDA